jgi:hypothetical protein
MLRATLGDVHWARTFLFVAQTCEDGVGGSAIESGFAESQTPWMSEKQISHRAVAGAQRGRNEPPKSIKPLFAFPQLSLESFWKIPANSCSAFKDAADHIA